MNTLKTDAAIQRYARRVSSPSGDVPAPSKSNPPVGSDAGPKVRPAATLATAGYASQVIAMCPAQSTDASAASRRSPKDRGGRAAGSAATASVLPWFRRAGTDERRGASRPSPAARRRQNSPWPQRHRRLPVVALLLSCISGGLPAALVTAQETAVAAVDVAVAEEPRVNINTATAEELSDSLSGVGARKAEAIVRYRAQFGPFGSIEELMEVKGIGAATVDRNRSLLRLED